MTSILHVHVSICGGSESSLHTTSGGVTLGSQSWIRYLIRTSMYPTTLCPSMRAGVSRRLSIAAIALGTKRRLVASTTLMARQSAIPTESMASRNVTSPWAPTVISCDGYTGEKPRVGSGRGGMVSGRAERVGFDGVLTGAVAHPRTNQVAIPTNR
jgi:hypothetical protein